MKVLFQQQGRTIPGETSDPTCRGEIAKRRRAAECQRNSPSLKSHPVVTISQEIVTESGRKQWAEIR